MPGRNIVKAYAADTYYHVYNRGVNRATIFKDDEDYRTFLNLLKRYLDIDRAKDAFGRPYEDMSHDIELLSYCLMPNHFHLFIYQYEPQAISRLLHRIITSYSIYFNKKHGRVGHLFQDRYKAADITSEKYLLHISRYIHLNPTDIGVSWTSYPYSSLCYFRGEKVSGWVKPQRVLAMFEGGALGYEAFVADYEDFKHSLKDIKYELAI